MENNLTSYFRNENKYELNNTDTNTQSNKKIFEIHKTEENKPKVSF